MNDKNMTIVFATSNEGKLKEIREIMKDCPWHIISAREAGVSMDVDENGTTFARNAYLKAHWVTEKTGCPAMADDSGLVIDALGGEPGIYSARYMGEDTPYEIKNSRILERMADVPEEKRSARFVCAIVCTFPDGRVLEAEETMEGRIAYSISGENGFGYDPIFFLPEFGATSAQISPEEKNAVSHRGKALRKMKKLLEKENLS